MHAYLQAREDNGKGHTAEEDIDVKQVPPAQVDLVFLCEILSDIGR